MHTNIVIPFPFLLLIAREDPVRVSAQGEGEESCSVVGESRDPRGEHMASSSPRLLLEVTQIPHMTVSGIP